MDIQFLKTNIDKPEALIPAIVKDCSGSFDPEKYKVYDPKKHKVLDTACRPDRIVHEPTGEVDKEGNPITNTKVVKMNRIPVPLQKLIVKRSAAFLAGGGVTLSASIKDDASAEALLQAVQECWDDNKLNFKNSEVAKLMMSETECAEIWYSKRDQEGNIVLRCNIYAPSMGYKLFPVFDFNRDLVAFGLQYESLALSTRYFDLYTADELRRFYNSGSGWKQAGSTAERPNPVKLQYGKMPVIYYNQERSEWDDVQEMIERLEEIVSNFGDTNDYNGSPILFAKGEIKGFAAKGQSGKVIESEGDGADLKYVTWDGAPEAIKLEIEKLLDFIYTCTQTPNISFQELKGLGGISGVAFDRIMIDGHLKAADKQAGPYGECIQRRINFLISAITAIKGELKPMKGLRITPTFSIFRINDESETIDRLMKANGNKPLISHKESIAQAGLTDDAEETFEAVKAELEEKEKREQQRIEQ